MNRRTVVTSVALRKELYIASRKVAERLGITRSELVSDLLEAYLFNEIALPKYATQASRKEKLAEIMQS